MKQDIAKSRVKYGGSGSEIQRDFTSDKTRKDLYRKWKTKIKYLTL